MRRHYLSLFATLPLLLLLGLAGAGVATAGGGCHEQVEAIATEASSTTVKLDGCTFAPTITRVPVGAEVRFVNDTGQPHDVTGRKFSWGSGELNKGESFTYRFRTAGMYPYSCSLHPGMAGVVIAGAQLAGAADAANAAEIAPVSATVPAAATSADASPVAYLAAGGLGLLVGVGVGAAVATRRRRPA